MVSARCLKFCTRVRGYATHPVYDYTNFETNAEGDCGMHAAACLFSQNSKKQPALSNPKSAGCFCTVRRVQAAKNPISAVEY